MKDILNLVQEQSRKPDGSLEPFSLPAELARPEPILPVFKEIYYPEGSSIRHHLRSKEAKDLISDMTKIDKECKNNDKSKENGSKKPFKILSSVHIDKKSSEIRDTKFKT